jgi:hypothetical protein
MVRDTRDATTPRWVGSWVALRSTRQSKPARDGLRAPRTLLATETARVTVAEESGYLVFRCRSEIPTCIVSSIKNMPQSVVARFREKPGTYSLADVAAALVERR